MLLSRFLLFALLGIESLVSGEDDYFAVSAEKRSAQMCGRQLANALKVVCGGIYNPMFKKSDTGTDLDWVKDLEEVDPSNEYEYLFRPRSHAQALIPHQGVFRRKTRGIVDECCHKPCHVKEMMGYCGSQGK